MPLLDWQAPRGTSVVLDRFWIYWAVTVPLTAMVLLSWSIWYLLSDYQRAPHRLAHREGSKDGSNRQKAFETHVLTSFGLGRLRKKRNGLVEDDTTEGMTDGMA